MPAGRPLDLRDLMQRAQHTQQQLMAAQAELAEAEVVGIARGGLVTVTMTAAGEPRAVSIDPRAAELGDTEALEELILEALNNVCAAIRVRNEEVIRPLTEVLGAGADGQLR